MRRGEILNLRWLDVDLRGARILLPQTKNGEERIVYLNELARMATRYQHLSIQFLSEAVGRLDAIFGEAHTLSDEARADDTERSSRSVVTRALP